MKRSTHSLAFVGAATIIAVMAACAPKDAGTDTARATGDSAQLAAAAATVAPAMDSAANAFMDPNTATAAQLATVPGIDSATAAALVAGRPYRSMVAVDKILAPKLSEAQRDSVYARLWTPIDLNTASDEEIQLIPGVAAKMLREFKEYRPYPQIDKFRREIGKYVDAAEVARLERYVTIK